MSFKLPESIMQSPAKANAAVKLSVLLTRKPPKVVPMKTPSPMARAVIPKALVSLDRPK